jgi:hypothetical protein
MNTNLVSPGLFLKDSNGDSVKIGPVHVGTTAPNATPGAGGQAGNSKGEAWLDTTATNPILKVWNGSAFVAVQPVGTGTVVSTTDTGTVTSTMILDGTILNADINASAAIVDTKLATIATGGKVSNSATTATNANTASAIVARDGSGNFSAGTITAAVTGAASSNVLKAGDTMTGALVVPLASAATPSLTFTGDLNTGIFSPGANQLAVATNATERARIDASGRLLVGTSTSVTSSVSQQSLLQVYSTSSSASSIQIGNYTAGVNAAGLHFDKSRGATVGTNTVLQSGDNIGSIKFNGADGTNLVRAAGIDCAVDGTPGANDMPGRLVFSTTADGASSPTERLRITSAGLVGIGTSTPSSVLEITSSSVESLLGVKAQGARNGYLDLDADANRRAVVRFNSAGVTQWSIGRGDSDELLASSFHISTGTSGGGSAKFVVTGAGNVGIGTTSPGAALETNAAAATSPFIAKINTGEVARIDSSGRLLVGTSTSATYGATGLLQILGSTNAHASIARATDNNAEPTFNLAKARGSVGTPTVVVSGDSLGRINFVGHDGTDYESIGAWIKGEVDGTPGANDMPGRLVFSTTADGASSPTERMRITSGGSVGIGVTPDSNHRVTIAGADNTSGNYALVVRNSVGANLFYLRNDSHFFADSIFNQTTAASANIHIDGAARLLRVTSSLKYKTNVETLEDSYADAILNVRPVWYQSLGANDNPDWGWWGFIAEEVAEVDPRLVSWKTTEVVEDENGSPLEQPLETPEPEGVHYDRFVPHLLNLIKRQQQAIETLEAKVAALEGV